MRSPCTGVCTVLLGALGLSIAASGCAGRLDERTRKAWKRSGAQADPGGPQSPDSPDTPGDGPNDRPTPALGWARVAEVLEGAVTVMRRSPDDDTLARLAQTWCAEEPRRETTDDGDVWTCDPKPPIAIDGARFTLELGAPGVIGLVAANLSLADGERIAQRARQTVERWCVAPWTAVSTHQDDPSSRKPKLETCPIEGGPQLAIARLPLDRTGLSWQVSVAIVGAS
jgi:hypothetical protein